MSKSKQALTDVDSHFAFGENWSNYSQFIDENKIAMAEDGLRRLLGNETLIGKKFIDIGCGSGLHSLAALRLGAAEVIATDIDPVAVKTTQSVLENFARNAKYRVEQISIFEINPNLFGTADIIYSWGVLHHTGNMNEAIKKAAKLVSSGGHFILALYQKTWCCPLWKIEKKWYCHASSESQKAARKFFIALLNLRQRLTGKNLDTYVQNYFQKRGMDFQVDLHDWMGGYPYESISPAKIDEMLNLLGFTFLQKFAAPKTPIGFFGSGCAEYVYQNQG